MEQGINILRKRNFATYQEVIQAYENSNKALVVQATGTGKSFLAIQLLLDNLDKKALFLCPQNGIIEQFQEHIDNLTDDNGDLIMVPRTIEEKNKNRQRGVYEWEIASIHHKLNLDAHTYAWLNNRSDEDLQNYDCDLIITDEAHRIGAAQWKQKMKKLLDSHQDSIVFGITATPVRERGKSKQTDISDKNFLFDGNVIQGETLEEALLNGNLPMPIYVNTSVQLVGKLEELQRKVEDRLASSDEKKEILEKIRQARKKLETSESIPMILERNLKKNGKYIVFCNAGEADCGNIKDIVSKMEVAPTWFQGLAKREDMVFYKCTYDEVNAIQEADNFAHNLDSQGNDVSDKLRVMFAINKYNEGIHVDDIDGVIMTRPTTSEIIYYQQLGRCLAVGKNYQPIVVDMAGNFEFAKQLRNKIREERKRQEKKYGFGGDGPNGSNEINFIDENDFILIDSLVETEEFIQALTNKLSLDLESKVEEFIQKIHEIERPIPTSDSGKYQFSDGTDMANWYKSFKQKIKKIQDKKEPDEEDMQVLEDYEKVNQVLRLYKVDKVGEFIQKVHEIKKPMLQSDSGKYQFSDGTDMANWYNYFKQKIKKIQDKKGKNEKDIQILKDYKRINQILQPYGAEVDKVDEFIQKVHEIKKPIPQSDRGKYQFSDGTDMASWYNISFKWKIKKIQDKQEKDEKDIQALEDYKRINQVLQLYGAEVDKVDEFIQKVHEIKKPMPWSDRGKYQFSDGVDMASWYINFKNKIRKIQDKKEKDEEDMQVLEDYEKVNQVLRLYKVDKVGEFIQKVHEIKKPTPQSDRGKYQFSDGTDMANWYNKFKQKIRKIQDKKEPDEEDMQELENYEKINQVLKLYEVDKVEEFIQKVHDIKGPIIKPDSGKYQFSDGTDMANWYNKFKQKIKKIQDKEEKDKKDIQVLEDYEKVGVVLDWYKGYNCARDYCRMYGDLNVIVGYKGKGNFKLREWLDGQRANYFNPDKSEVQLMYERLLDELCPSWVTKYDVNKIADAIVENLSRESDSTDVEFDKAI